MTTMGAHVTLCGPSTLVPRNTELLQYKELAGSVSWETDVYKAVEDAANGVSHSARMTEDITGNIRSITKDAAKGKDVSDSLYENVCKFGM
jgi:hypothetical protein